MSIFVHRSLRIFVFTLMLLSPVTTSAVPIGQGELRDLIASVKSGSLGPDTKIDGYTLLYLTVLVGAPSDVKNLLIAGADPNKHSRFNIVALQEAVHPRCQLEKSRLLVNHGANIEHVWEASGARGEHLVHMAASSGEAGCLRLLLLNGADPNATDKQGRTPLFYAKGDAVIALLFDAGADPYKKDAGGIDAFHYSVVRNKYQYFRKYLEYHRSLNGSTRDLIQHEDGVKQNEIFDRVYDLKPPGCRLQELKAFLDNGGDPNVKDHDGAQWSLLHYAVNLSEDECVEVLIEHGADIGVVDNRGRGLGFWVNSVSTLDILMGNGLCILKKNQYSLDAIHNAILASRPRRIHLFEREIWKGDGRWRTNCQGDQ